MIKRHNLYMVLWTAVLAVGFIWMPPGLSPAFGASLKTVVIDPGHGGRDTGAVGPSGTKEKDVCLALAAILKRNLTKAYNVILTRGDDYDIDNLKRTAIANHEKADLFISLHTGAAFSHSARGMAVYTYLPADKDESEPPPPGNGRPRPWRQLQLAHLAQSRALAEALQRSLTNLDRSSPVQVQQGPLIVLVGADMPAVIAEIGQLSNPDTEKALSSEDQLRSYARAIAGAIDSYFSSRP